MNSDARAATAARLRKAREAAGLSQGQVANRIGVHRPTVSEIEAGRRRVSSEEVAQFAILYGVTNEWLLTGRGVEADGDERIALAARELGKMKSADIDKLIDMLRRLRRTGARR